MIPKPGQLWRFDYGVKLRRVVRVYVKEIEWSNPHAPGHGGFTDRLKWMQRGKLITRRVAGRTTNDREQS